MKNKIVLFGASGFTGGLTLKALVKQGVKPFLLGRNINKLKAISILYGGLDYAQADADNVAEIACVLNKGDVLISTVGPFTRCGEAAVEAAISRQAHYVDSTGEPGFIRKVFERYGALANEQGVTLLTAMGYDYVPGNMAAAAALSLASSATRVDVGYFVSGGRPSASQGTQASVMQAMLEPGVYFSRGLVSEKMNRRKVRQFLIHGKKRPASLVSGSEHLALPISYPALQEINTYLGWFGLASYVIPWGMTLQEYLFKVPGYKKGLDVFLQKYNHSEGKGPDEAERIHTRTEVVAIAYDAQGKALSEAVLSGANPYDFTADILAWTAIKGLDSAYRMTGAAGPVAALGMNELLSGCQHAGLELEVSRIK